ncbi:sulfotransferase family protein [Salinibacter ruber]|uniref:sulfotransferase family protein n=1 Tax=Salinibacter ruber TaxID=146919 RepID=UPI0021672607|nr:sulfotransferase [Salinibacter ruber]
MLLDGMGGRKHYPVFIVGSPRSGTTLLYQLLARETKAAYVSNFVSRFWGSPVVGAHLYDLVYHEDSKIPLTSRVGRTPGPHSPHEFAWFWQYWCDWPDVDDVSTDVLEAFPWERIRREIRGLSQYFGSPLVLKSLNYTNYQIDWLSETFPNAKFLWIRRDPLFTVQSMFKVRKRVQPDPHKWWSIRPSDYTNYLGQSLLNQVCHQYNDIINTIRESFVQLENRKKHTVTYESLTENTIEEIWNISRFVGVDCSVGDIDGSVVSNRNRKIIDETYFEKMKSLLDV